MVLRYTVNGKRADGKGGTYSLRESVGSMNGIDWDEEERLQNQARQQYEEYAEQQRQERERMEQMESRKRTPDEELDYAQKKLDEHFSATDQKQLSQYTKLKNKNQDIAMAQAAAGGYAPPTKDELNDLYKERYMASDLEKKSGGRGAFDLFKQYSQELVDKEDYDKLQADLLQNAKTLPGKIENAALSTIASLGGGVQALAELPNSLFYADKNAPINTYSRNYGMSNLQSLASQANARAIATGNNVDDPNAETVHPVASWLYQTGQSTLDSMANRLLGPMGLANMGLNAGAQSLQNSLNRGLSTGQALGTAGIAGAAEVLTEKFSMDHFWDMAKNKGSKAAKNAIIDWLVQAGIEGSEEVGSDIINNVADALINGDKSEYNVDKQQRKEAYMKEGLSEKEANERASQDATLQMLADTGLSFLGGAVSGGVSGGAALGLNTGVRTVGGRNLIRNTGGTQGLKDTLDYQSFEGQESNQALLKAQDYADYLKRKDNNNQRITGKDARTIYDLTYDALGKETEYLRSKDESPRNNETPELDNPSYDKNDQDRSRYGSEYVPDEYKTKTNNLTLAESNKQFNQALENKDVKGIEQAYRDARNSEDETVRAEADRMYAQTTARAVADGIATREEFNAARAVPTKEQAYSAGLNNQNMSNLSEENQLAYNEGKQKRIETQASQTVAKDADIKGMEVTSDGTIKQNGTEIKAADIEDAGIRKLAVNAQTQITPEAKANYLKIYSETAMGTPVGMYDTAFSRFYKAGASKVQSFEDVLKNNDYMKSQFSEETLRRIYDLGASEKGTERETSSVRKGSGKVIDKRDNKKTGKKYMPMLEHIAKTLGIDIEVRDDMDNQVNGSFTKGTSTMVFNANSRKGFQTIFHEAVGEFAEAWNEAGMVEVQDALIQYLIDTKGEDSLGRRGELYQETYREFGEKNDTADKDKSYRDALNEMVNDTLWEIFSTEDGINDFANWLKETMPQQQQTILQKIADFMERILDSMQQLIGSRELSKADRQLAEMEMEAAKELRAKVLDALSGAVENYKNSEQGQQARIEHASEMMDAITGKNGKTQEENRKAVQDYLGGEMYTAEELEEARDSSYSLNREDELMELAQQYNKEHRNSPLKDFVEAKKIRRIVRDELKKYKDLLPEDIEGNIMKANSSYSMTAENARVCVRSIVSQWFMDQVSETVGHPLSIDEQLVASQLLAEVTGDQRECTYCYVKTDRATYRATFNDYFKQYTDLVNKVKANPDKYTPDLDRTRDDVVKELVGKNGKKKYVLNGTSKGFQEFVKKRAATQPMWDRYQAFVRAAVEGSDFSLADLTTMSKRNSIANNENDNSLRAWLVKDAENYSRSAAWPTKMTIPVKINGVEMELDYVAYNGNILKMSEEVINDLNQEYGLRMYSYTDYVPAFLLENMQIVTDASARGLKMLAYTKDVGFARVFGSTGMGINISLAGTWNANTKQVDPDGMMGANWDEAKAARDKYPNVGTTFVAFDDNMVNWALDQDWIDTVIPYHLVRTGKDVAKAYGYKNYANQQSDKKISKEWNADPNKDNLIKSIPPTIHKNDQKLYEQALKDNHLKPRFQKWWNNPNYMKLVNETRMSYDKMKPVRPRFDQEAVMQELSRIPNEGKYGLFSQSKTMEEQEDKLGAYIDDAADAINAGVRLRDGKLVNKNGDALSGTQFSLNVIPENINDLISENRKSVKDMEIVSSIKNNVFPKDGRRFSEKALEFFNSVGNNAVNPIIGDVELSMRTIESDIAPAHGRLTRVKAITFKSIPDVIEKGKIIGFKENHKGRGYDSVIIAAPVEITGAENENGVGKYMVGVIVNRNKGQDWQKFYLHKYDIIKRDESLKSTESSGTSVYDSSPIIRLLRSLGDDNTEDIKFSINVDSTGRKLSDQQKEFFKDSKMVDENGALKIMYHGTNEPGFTVFDPKKSDDGRNLFFTDKKYVASTYVKGERGKRKDTEGKIYGVYLNLKNPMIVEGKGSDWDFITRRPDLEISWRLASLAELIWGETRVGKSDILEAAQNEDISFEELAVEAGKQYPHALGKNGFIETLRIDGKRIDKLLESFKKEQVMEELIEEGYDEDEIDEMTDKEAFLIVADDISEVWSTRELALKAKKEGYDGVILKNIYDIGIYGRFSPDSTVAIAFNSNQVKSIDNMNPTEDVDIRMSLNIPESRFSVYDNDFDDIMSEDLNFDDVLISEDGSPAPVNFQRESMKEMASVLEMGAKAMKGQPFSKKKLHDMAMKYKSYYNSSYSAKDLADNLEKFFRYVTETGHVDREGMMSVIKEIAMPVIERSGATQDERQLYQDFKDAVKGYTIKLNDQQKQEARSKFGSVSNWARAMGGIVQVNDKTGQSLDSVWEEMAERTNGVLNPYLEDVNQPLALADAFNALVPTGRTKAADMYGMNADDMAYDLGLQMIQDYYGEQEPKVVQDTKALKKKYREEIKRKFDERLEKALADQEINLRESYEHLNEKYRQEAIAKDKKPYNIALAKARMRQSFQDRADRQEARKMRDEIQKNVNEMRSWIVDPTEKKHIPKEFAGPVAEFITAFDFVTPEIKKYDSGKHEGMWGTYLYQYTTADGRPIYKFVGANTKENAWQKVNEEISKQFEEGTGSRGRKTWQEKMRGLSDLLTQIKDDNDGEFASLRTLIDPDAEAALREILRQNGRLPSISMLKASELKSLNNLMKNMKTAINKQNEFFIKGRNASIEAAAMQHINFMDGKKEHRDLNGLRQRAWHLVNVSMITPSTFFHMIGADDIYERIRSGMNKRTMNIKAAEEYTAELLKGVKGADKWRKEIHTLKDLDGREMKVSTAQIMSLYELSKRPDAARHFVGGFVPDKINGKQVNETKAYHLSKDDIKALTDKLTDEQKRVADGMQKYLADDCSKQGNEVSEAMFGYKKYTDGRYFPMKVDPSSIGMSDKSAGQELFNAITNSGFTKATKDNAKNALMLEDIFSVYTRHITDMATYNGYAMPLSDALRWFNFKVITKNEAQGTRSDTVNIQNAIKRVGGMDYIQYFKNLYRDINGETSGGTETDIANAMISRYKAAAVGANLRVAIQQPTAYMRAANLVDPKYLLKAQAAANVNVYKMSKDAKYAQENNPIAYWKSKGYYDNSMGQSLEEIITGQKTALDMVREYTSILAQYGDDFTWGMIYKAVEYEQKDKHKDMDFSSQEFRDIVNKRMDDVVDQTQVVDSVLHRSQFMRSKDTLTKIEAAFQAEPTKTYNMLYRAVMDGNKKGIARAATVFIVTAVECAAAASVMDAFRSDDDEKEWLKRYLEALTGLNGEEEGFLDKLKAFGSGNIGGGLNVASMIPYVKDALSLMDGYDLDRMDTAGISNLIKACQEVVKYFQGDSNKTQYGITRQAVKALSQVTGIPGYGMWREVESIHNAFYDNWQTKKAGRYDGLKKAIKKDGDIASEVSSIKKDLMDSGKTEKEANTQIKSSITSAYKQEMIETKSADLKNRLIKAYMAAGDSREDAIKKIDKWFD